MPPTRKTPLRDLVIVLPGIMGSRLAKRDGGDLWNPGYGMARSFFGRRKWLRDLAINVPDDPGDPRLLDGVRPVGLVESKTIVPGIVRIGGYSELHDKLDEVFNLYKGDQHNPTATVNGSAPNYFHFAYDWRRDNRASALQLKSLIDVALPAWRASSGRDTAKVILIAHSMGGLVARWYLEGVHPSSGAPLEGWRNVSQLITFGTPYRGSLNALENLVEGFRKPLLDFSEALATFTAAYQLMPRYQSVLDQRSGTPEWKHPAHVLGVSELDHARALDAYEGFYQAIDDGVIANRAKDGYDDRYVVPIIGFGHATHNSAILTDNGVELSDDLPPVVPTEWLGGDGTVPYLSAIPLDYDGLDEHWHKVGPMSFANKKHGEIQRDQGTLAAEIAQALQATQVSGGAARDLPEPGAADPKDSANSRPHLGLNLPDWVPGGEQLEIGVPTEGDYGGVRIVVSKFDDEGNTTSVESVKVDCSPEAHHAFSLEPGEYLVEATALKAVPGFGRLASSDFVAVVDPKELDHRE